jgi:bifunctional pyridoxal-dependent enzyme with beta-cystathionase and maltose regulon repressor activities
MHNMRRVDALLGTCALDTLRQRRSFKWRTYPADVLPAFVAEMDFDLARPVIDAAAAALALGDCGYGHQGVLGEVFAAFAADRLGWAADPARVFAIPDVMTGLAEVIQALTPPGAGVVINPPVYPPFWFRFGFSGRRIVEAPLAVGAQLDENRGRLRGLLGEQLPAARYQPPQASFLAWIDCRGLGLDDDPAATFLDRGRVALSPGGDFGRQGHGFARLNMGTSPELLAEAVRRMAAATRPGR